MYHVTMQITFPIPEIAARKERNLHCDVVHVTTKWISRLVLDHAIAAIQIEVRNLQGQEIISLHIHKHTHKCYNFNIEK